MRVLVLEDDEDLRTSVVEVLRGRGMAVDEATCLGEADEKLRITDYDACVLDRMLPDGDAAAMMRDLRRDGVVAPVLFLSGLDDLSERVAGLDAGADDYLVKPFAMDELLARVRALARRREAVDQPVLRLADLAVDVASMAVTRAGRPVTLTPKEYAILVCLVRSAGQVVTRGTLIEHCWDEFADPVSNVVDVRVRMLRTKLGDPPLVHTVRGAGYMARADG
nr:response regulator transcription factor [Kineosporia sp. A_224]